MYFKKLIHPEFFQGDQKKNHYFEGWYYKLVSPDENYTLAFIPGVSINQIDPHAFIQVFISSREGNDLHLKTHNFRYALETFLFDHHEFSVRIGENFFSLKDVQINLKNDAIDLTGSFELLHLTPIHKNIYMPNIMGPFGYLNFMECNHGILSMNHEINGSFSYNGTIISLDSAKGYIEKDWGKSFPRAYVWLQSNHFKDRNTSFMFSYADIPFLGLYFKGLIVNLVYQKREYRFATYNRSKVLIEKINPNHVFYRLKKGKYQLDIHAETKAEIELASPKDGRMIHQIKEGLSGEIQIKLYYKNALIYEDIGYHAGIEIMKK